MGLRSPHRDWRLDLISPVDVRAVGRDQLLTRLWLRILFKNKPLVTRSNAHQTVAELANVIERPSNQRFRGFSPGSGAAETWLRADLVKTLRRSPERFTVGRPVHALATRVRSTDKQTDDSSASLAVYSWLEHLDKGLVSELRDFIEVDLDDDTVDLATLALALLAEDEDEDTPRTDKPQPVPSPLCRGQASAYCDDLRRLLAYRATMPRSALVDHIRRLTGFHLGLYLLRVFRIVVEAERRAGDNPACAACARGQRHRGMHCPYKLELLADFGEDARSPVARMAEESWALQEGALSQYVRSHLALKKLHEFATYLAEKRPSDAVPHGTVWEIAAVEHSVRGEVIDMYFDNRLESLREATPGEEGRERLSELEADYRSMGLSPFRIYVAILAYFSERRWVNYHRYLLDSLFAKNTGEGLLRQPLGGKRRRRAAMGAALLETLTLIAVVDGTTGAYFTRPLRVDQLIDRLETRYDLLVTRPPVAWADDLQTARLLAVNGDRFKARLRETGLFTDLSDAFLAQLVRPRLSLGNE
jgi:hypothetical protein